MCDVRNFDEIGAPMIYLRYKTIGDIDNNYCYTDIE